ncbi:MAG: hypothetical protein KatS3mg105_3675 [Gemmatales bacterium]|nr:MAG: hypothetical protein KatS3mg105_3675 [Gemmatales bacterium]
MVVSVELATELESLSSTFRELAPKVAEAAKNLENGGIPPDEATIFALQAARQRFYTLRDAAIQTANQEHLSNIPDEDGLASLADLEKLVCEIKNAIAERERKAKIRDMLNQAAVVLERVLAIVHRDTADYAPLAECQQKARALLDDTKRDPDQLEDLGEFQALAESTHPFCELLTFIEKRDDLNDEEFEKMESEIIEKFGKPIATACTRGKLLLTVPTSPPAETPPANSPADATTEVIVVPATEQVSPEDEAESYRRPAPDNLWHRSPLTAEQEKELLADSSGVCVLFGSRLAGLDELERFLEFACDQARLITVDVATDRSGFLRELESLLIDRPDGMIVLIVPALCPWSEDWILRSLELIKKKAVDKKVTRVIFVADPEAAWTWVRMDEDLRKSLLKGGLVECTLKPWTNSALKAWLDDAKLSDLDPYIRERFTRITGNWGELIHQVGIRCQDSPEHWQEHLAEIEREITSRAEWEDRLGLVAQAHPVLRAMAQLTQPVDYQAIFSRANGISRERVDAVLRWANLLSYVRRASHNQWALDPVVRQVVLQSEE